MNAIDEYERLLKHFERDLQTASELKTPNAEDTIEIRAAIVGFSYNSLTEQWGKKHYDYVREHSLKDVEIPESERAFYALCLGYLLGLFQSGRISEHDCFIAENQIAGFVLLKAGGIG